jgi:hypothetical protein
VGEKEEKEGRKQCWESKEKRPKKKEGKSKTTIIIL